MEADLGYQPIIFSKKGGKRVKERERERGIEREREIKRQREG